jgi:hypothetical protein
VVLRLIIFSLIGTNSRMDINTIYFEIAHYHTELSPMGYSYFGRFFYSRMIAININSNNTFSIPVFL